MVEWEKERPSAELEAIRIKSLPKSADEDYSKRRDIRQRKVDSEVYFKLPEDTSGYASSRAQPLSSFGMSPQLVQKETRHVESTPQQRFIQVSAPCSPSTNPFVDIEVRTVNARGFTVSY